MLPGPIARTRSRSLSSRWVPGVLLRLSGLACAAWLALSTSGCKGCNEHALPAPTDGGAPLTTNALTPEQAAKVVAKVGDKTLTLGDFVVALEHMDAFDRLRYQSPERRKELLNEIVNIELLAQEAKEKGYDQDALAQQEIRAILRDAMLVEARRSGGAPADIPDSEVAAYYEAHKADFSDPERRRLSIIVVRDEGVAKQVLEAAKGSSAARWGELVRTRSVDTQARANVPVDLAGDVGFVGPIGDDRGDNPRVPDEVRAAAYAIPEVGGVYEAPVRAAGGFYLVRLTQKAEPRARSLAESDRAIRVKLAQERMRAREQEILDALRAEIPVQIDEAALAQVRVKPGTLDAGSDER